MTKIEPIDGETPLDFVQRADSLKIPEGMINRILTDHFGYADDGEIKELKLQSKPFWDQFYREHVEGIFQRGGTRYAALRFIQRKNDHADEHRRLSEVEIERIVDSAGEWPR
ncbi:hypothetical protein [Shimia sp. FJ5]|uniref:hypothetical protein n=1 Tax=Shimia sp. FJ5 TaxID=3079054 RepID=UPI00293DD5F7|nr:hypothetical protein [Shimia sp. FJ5]MDV4145831.1 hypothetical protein [Shimia sp. FJ5]